MGDLIFYVQWMNIHDRLQNRPKFVTNAWNGWFLTFITHEYRQYCYVGNTAKTMQTGTREILRIQNPLLEEHYVSLEVTHLFQQVGCVRNKHSHSSTESEIISLDTGLRLDGLPALELWDLIVSVFGNVSHVSDRAGQPVNGKNKSHNKINVVHDIDLVPSNVQSANR